MNKVELYVQRTRVGDSIKWSELYDNEDDLIVDLLNTSNNVKGYEYINLYKNKLRNGEGLNGKEITQLKRLAKYIFADIHKL